jgi:hypothetical protein
MRHTRARWLVLAALLATCGEPTAPPVQPQPQPQPGVLVVRLVTPNDDDGAVVVRVSGPGQMTSIAAGGAGLVLHARPDGAAFSAAVFGDVASGAPLLRFTVPDVAAVLQYSATLVEVADEGNAVRAGTEGYALTVERLLAP